MNKLPKIVLFVGNGFTIGLSDHLGIGAEHNTIKLLPPPKWIQDAASSMSAKALPLWHKRRYPALWEAWEKVDEDLRRRARSTSDHNTSSDFHVLCNSLSKNESFKLGPDPQSGPAIVFNHFDAGYQMRRYLWYLFYLYNSRLLQTICPIGGEQHLSHKEQVEGLKNSTADWALMGLVRLIAKCCDLSIVSFNYDSYIEMLLLSYGHMPFTLNDKCYDSIDDAPAGSVRVVHPHGSMSHHRPGISGPELAFLDDLFEEKVGMVFVHMIQDYFPVQFVYPYPSPCPDYPDLVPPGHASSHLLAKWSDYAKTIRELVSRADLIGCLGFSAAPPDDVGFKEYLSDVNREVQAFSIGIHDPNNQPLSYQIMATSTGVINHEFFDINEIDECANWLSARFEEF